jgi:hypothetical protein
LLARSILTRHMLRLGIPISPPSPSCDPHHSVRTSSTLKSTRGHAYRIPLDSRRQNPHSTRTAILQSNDTGTEGRCPSQCGGPAGARHLQSNCVEAAGDCGRSARATTRIGIEQHSRLRASDSPPGGRSSERERKSRRAGLLVFRGCHVGAHCQSLRNGRFTA